MKFDRRPERREAERESLLILPRVDPPLFFWWSSFDLWIASGVLGPWSPWCPWCPWRVDDEMPVNKVRYNWRLEYVGVEKGREGEEKKENKVSNFNSEWSIMVIHDIHGLHNAHVHRYIKSMFVSRHPLGSPLGALIERNNEERELFKRKRIRG